MTFSFQSEVFVNVQSTVSSFSLCLLRLYCALYVKRKPLLQEHANVNSRLKKNIKNVFVK